MLARVYLASGKYAEAEPLLKKSMELREATQGTDTAQNARGMNSMAEFNETMGNYAEAEQLYKKALEIRRAKYGNDNPQTAQSLRSLASLYKTMGRYEDARKMASEALDISRKKYGKDHPNIADALHTLADVQSALGEFDTAEDLCRQAMRIREAKKGKTHPAVAESEQLLGSIYRATGRNTEAEVLFKDALKIRQDSFGPDHPLVAQSLTSLGFLYLATGRYADAEIYLKKGLDIRQKALVPEHQDIAGSLGGLARLYMTLGRYAEAEQLLSRSTKMREKLQGVDHPRYSGNISSLAELYEAMGKYGDAEILYKKVLEIRVKARGSEHPGTARVMTSLAGLYLKMGKYEDAEKLASKAIKINQEKLGKERVETARSMEVMAEILIAKGQYAEAEPLCKQALGIRERILSKEHPAVAESRLALADLYRNSGRTQEAENEYKKALEIQEKSLGKDHLEVARTLNLLGSLYQAKGAEKEAEQFYLRALEISEKAFGKYHPEVAESYDTLAGLYLVTGKPREAELRYKAALEIRQKVYGANSPFLADSMHNLGVLYRSIGRYEASEHYLQQAYTARKNALGANHPKVASSAKELALLYAHQGKHRDSQRFFEQNLRIEGIKRDNVFLLLSEREKLVYMNETERSIHEYLSHTSKYLASDQESLAGTFNAWLQWKGAVMEAQGKHLAAVAASGNAEMKTLFDDLTTARREIAKLQTSRSTDAASADYRAMLLNREKLKEALEARLSGLSRDFEVDKKAGKADTAGIARILPPDSVYLDFARIPFFDYQKKSWNEPRYLVFVLRPGEKTPLALLDLGPAETLDRHISAFLTAMNASRYGYIPNRKTLDKEAGELYQLLLGPIEQQLSGKTRLYISPDGNLNLIPFEVLPDEKGAYTIEKFQISYIAAGRDIARFEPKETGRKQGVAALILADPDYDFGLSTQEKTAEAGGAAIPGEAAASPKTNALASFARLPDTKKEADTIEEILTRRMSIAVNNYQDKKAVEAVLTAAESPIILHLATHGYFIGKEESDRNTEAADSGQMLLRDNPMLRSGIALAGINLSLNEGRDEGIMSAEKVMGLKLMGTDLVVLSACETGLGDVRNGEGVFGLKRAFILSGAKAVVLSLWSVPSEETMELMTRFYELMADGKSKSDALKQSKLELMKKKPNPFYWGAFILVGNPG